MVSSRRQYNFELLRIISMLMIISLHFFGHCIKIKEIQTGTILFYVGWFFEAISLVSVNIYVLISAYFLCNSKFKFEKLIRIMLEVLFYSIVIWIFSGNYKLNGEGYLHVFLPCISGEYWFATCYIGLYILSPFLNIAIRNLKEPQHRMLILILLTFFVIIPNVFSYSRWLGFGGGSGIVWFVTLYIVGAYIKNHIDIEELKTHKKVLRSLMIGLLMLPFLVKISITFVSQKLFSSAIGLDSWFHYNSILIFLATIPLFLYTITIEITNDKIGQVILFLSRSTFAVYLIHDNNWLRIKLWDTVKPLLQTDSFMIIPQFLLIVSAIFIACVLLDQLRLLLFRRLDRTGVFIKLANELNSITGLLYRTKS